MRPARKKRLYLIMLMVIGIGIATGLALFSFQENLMFFYAPSEVLAGEAPDNHPFRLGGLVVAGSVQRKKNSLTIGFIVTDNAKTVPVEYTGILPDLFREGQGIIANGRLRNDGVFVADEVLAKHDENYMPPEVAESLKTAHQEGVKDSAEKGPAP